MKVRENKINSNVDRRQSLVLLIYFKVPHRGYKHRLIKVLLFEYVKGKTKIRAKKG